MTMGGNTVQVSFVERITMILAGLTIFNPTGCKTPTERTAGCDHMTVRTQSHPRKLNLFTDLSNSAGHLDATRQFFTQLLLARGLTRWHFTVTSVILAVKQFPQMASQYIIRDVQSNHNECGGYVTGKHCIVYYNNRVMKAEICNVTHHSHS